MILNFLKVKVKKMIMKNILKNWSIKKKNLINEIKKENKKLYECVNFKGLKG